MKKGGAIYDQIMQTEPSRKMPPPFYGPQPNNLQETIYYQHGFPLVSTHTWSKIFQVWNFKSDFFWSTKKVGNYEKWAKFLSVHSIFGWHKSFFYLNALKFMFSKKATKIGEIFTIDLTLCSKRQMDGEEFINFCGLLWKYELYLKIQYKKSGAEPLYLGVR